MNKKINQLGMITVLIIALLLGLIGGQKARESEKVGVTYYSHIQDKGWEKEYSKQNGQTSGTMGQNLKAEAVKIKLVDAPKNAEILYQAHVQDIGWQNWINNGDLAGTTGRNLKMEAIRIKLKNLENYSVEYRVHVQDIGWQEWKIDGELAGTTGRNLKIEALEIKIILKTPQANIQTKEELQNKTFNQDGILIEGNYATNLENSKLVGYIDEQKITEKEMKNSSIQDITEQLKIGNGKNAYQYKIQITDMNQLTEGTHIFKLCVLNQDKTKTITQMTRTIKIDKTTPIVQYKSFVQNRGWQDFVKGGQTTGTTGKNLKMEAIQIQLKNAPSNVKIQYRTHIQDIGWQEWKENRQTAGMTGRNLKVEALQIQLMGTDDYSVQYRTHVQDIGWQNWVTDGEIAGTTGRNLKVEAIEIKMIPKIKKAKIELETNISNTTITKEGIQINGWRLVNIANTKLKVYLDNIAFTGNIEQIAREDINQANLSFGGKPNNPTPGFKLHLTSKQMEQLTDGEHNLKIQIVSPDEKQILAEKNTKFKTDKTNVFLQYTAHVQDIGWQSNKNQGETAGVIGRGLKIEAIKIQSKNLPKDVKLTYQTHVQDIGWQSWATDGTQAGTTGRNLKIEALKIKLEDSKDYSIMYRTYIEGKGWQNWANDGEISGTTGKNLKVEGIEIKIVPKIGAKIDFCLDEPVGNIVEQKSTKVAGWLMTNIPDTQIRIMVDNQIMKINPNRTKREDVLEKVKGYGGEEYNPNPGYEADIDFSKIDVGNKILKVQVIDKKGNIIKEISKTIQLRKKVTTEQGIYGISGLRKKGETGYPLTYYRYGDGPNVFFATFSVHGFEDNWNHDGKELTEIANQFFEKLKKDTEYQIADKWTVYIFPQVNPDGANNGWTNNGPGRTTLYSQAPNNKGIDMNRCWQVGNSYQRYVDNRNYNGTTGFQAYEAEALRDFLITHKATQGQTVLVDLHGWTQQLIGDQQICSYYRNQFPENDGSAIGRYGTGYLVNWARQTLGNNGKVAKSALIELPNQGVQNHNSVVEKNFANRYIESTFAMLKGI